MNNKIIDILEFDKVKALFQTYLVTAQGQTALADALPQDDATKIQTKFDELSELQTLVIENGKLPIASSGDVSEFLRRIELEATLSGLEFAKIKRLLRVGRDLRHYFEEAENVELSALQDKISKLADLGQVLGMLQIIDDTGHVEDSATPRLMGLRATLKRLDSDVKKAMQEALSRYSASISDNIVTIRNDRPVLAVKAEAKSKVPGIIHDISATGQTVYIEPNSVNALGNALNQARIEERNEVAAILKDLSEALLPFVPDIRQSAWVIGEFDLLNAKYQFMVKHNATVPTLTDNQDIKLMQMRHPLIDARKVVANDLVFGADLSTIVITGPNTGGKTITLKTLGLAQLMAQAGFPILAARGSSVGVFDQVYADIGDEQSIEANLSTFSSHMTTIVDILGTITSRSLVLFDELGAGTDPKEGAALAISILEYLRARHVKTMATTHYPELKAYGVETPGVLNASMVFDVEALKPTYRLVLGIPGRSNALDISTRLGLPADIVAAAKAQISDDEHDVNDMIAALEAKNHELDASVANIRRLEKDNATMYDQLKGLHDVMTRERENELNKARKEAKQIVEKASQESQTILKDLHERAALKPHEVIAARAEIEGLAPDLVDLSNNKVLKKAKAARGLKAGAEVLVTSYGQRGTLVKLEKDGRWLVQMGMIQARLAENEFEPIEVEKTEAPKKKKNTGKRPGGVTIKAQLDLRGMRYEEAEQALEDYIDKAYLANLHQITIVHGIGTGVIREMVTKYLQRSRHIKSYNYAPQEAGGSGATIAILQ
jgi:DNA mismatch repair protein MutS2